MKAEPMKLSAPIASENAIGVGQVDCVNRSIGDKGCDQGIILQVPDFDGVVPGAGHDGSSIGGEGDGVHPVRVTVEGAPVLA